jgi:glycosyltransferase involved in cell wall biosynthesis
LKKQIKRILIIGPFPLPTTGVSIANQVVRDSLKSKTDYRVEFVDTSYSSFEEKLGKLSFKKVMFYLLLQLQFYRIFNNDIIYMTPGQTFYGVLKYALYVMVASLSRKRIIQHIHGNYLGRQYAQLSGVKKGIFKNILCRTDKGIVLSNSLKNNFSPFLPANQIYELKNFVVDELFFEDKTLENKDYHELKIVYLSNLITEKGIFELLECLKMLENESIPYSARIAGNIADENRELLTSYFNHLDATEYIGVVDIHQKQQLLEWSNIFVLPTYYIMEGQPISILEAMATGNLILTTAHAGIPDIFEEGKNGFFVQPRDPKSIFSQLQHITNNRQTIAEISRNNVVEAREHYRVSTFTQNLIEILEA